MPELTIDTSAFEHALKRYMMITSKSLPVAVNSCAKDIIIEAGRITPKAKKDRIESDIWRTVIPKSGGKPRPLVYMLVNKQQREGRKRWPQGPALSGSGMSSAARRLQKQRNAAIGYIAYAGWNNALKAVGGKGFGSKAKSIEGSQAENGYGTPASVENCAAVMTNYAQGAAKVGGAAFQEAMNTKAKLMLEYVASKLVANWKA